MAEDGYAMQCYAMLLLRVWWMT